MTGRRRSGTQKVEDRARSDPDFIVPVCDPQRQDLDGGRGLQNRVPERTRDSQKKLGITGRCRRNQSLSDRSKETKFECKLQKDVGLPLRDRRLEVGWERLGVVPPCDQRRKTLTSRKCRN